MKIRNIITLLLSLFFASETIASTHLISSKDTLHFFVSTCNGPDLPAQIITPENDSADKIVIFINGSTPYDEKGNMAPFCTEKGRTITQPQDFYIRFLDIMSSKNYGVVSMAKRSFVEYTKIPRPTLDDLAMDVVSLIGELKKRGILTTDKKLYLVGYSEGSVVASKALGLLKEQPEACILLGSGSNAFDYHNKTWEDWPQADIIRKTKNWTDEQLKTEFQQWKDVVLQIRQINETTFENEFKHSSPHGFGFAQWESYHIDKEMSNYYPEANILDANIPLLICIGESDTAMPEKRARQTYQNLLDKGFSKVTYKVIPEEVHQYKKFDVFGITDTWIQSDFTSTEFKITPEDEAMIEKYTQRQQWSEELNSLPYDGNHSGEVLAFYNKVKSTAGILPGDWFTLGVKLFGNGFRKEARQAFSEAAVKGNLTESAALVWLGHLSDLSDDRDKALLFYRRALECYPGFGVQHSQWNMELNREWIEERLEEPFAF
ncbi:MAG: hypothetical protein ACQETJ_14605 [Bacteroidota bacterium]